MEAIELLIENQRVDLLKGIHEKISYTLSASDLGKLTQKHADIVQEFEVPYTSNNLGIFDFIAAAGYDCEFYKRKLKADLFFQGFPLIVDGWCRVLKCNEKTINICIYSRTENLHDSLGDKKITDLNFSDFNHPKNLEEFYKKFSTSDRSSYVYALANFQKVDFGEFESGVKEYIQRANEEDDRDKRERIRRKGKSQAAIDLANSGFFLATAASGVKGAGRKVDIQFQLPSVYVSALWKKIFKEAGYFTYEGDIFQNSDFLEEVIPPSQFKYEVEGKLMDTASQRSLIGCFEVKNVDDYRSGELKLEKTTADCSIKQKDRGLLGSFFSEYVNIEYDGLLIPKMELKVTRNKYVNPHINHTHIIFLKFENAGQYARKTASDFYRYALHLNDTSGVEERNNVEVSYDEHEQTVEAPEMNVKRGNVIVVLQELLAENLFYGAQMGFFDDVRSDVKGKIKFYSVDESVAGLGYVRFENILPDIKQIDFINDIIQRYGLVFQYDKSRKKHLKFAYLKDILRKKKGTEDWTEKFVRLESEDYIIDSQYCQNNYMKYKYAENYVNINKDLIKRKKLEHDYDGNIEIPNEVLNFRNNLWTSPYTIGKYVGAISLQAIQTFRNTDRFTVLGEPFLTGKLELLHLENRLSIPIYEKTALQSYKFAKTNPHICYAGYDENEYNTTICYGNKIGEGFRYVTFLYRKRLNYQHFIDHYYSEFTEVLRRSKKVTMWMKLDVVDVWNLDFFKLKYINQRGRFFYLNKVLNFNGTGFTKCEFLELPLSFSGVYVQPDIDTSVKFSLREQISKSIYPEIVFDEHFYINEFSLGLTSSTSKKTSNSSNYNSENTKNSIENTNRDGKPFYFQFESCEKATNKYNQFVLEDSNFKEGVAFSSVFPYPSLGSKRMICCFKEGDKFESWARYHFRDKQNPNDRTNSATMYFHVDVAKVGSRTEAGAKRYQEEAKKAYGYGILDYESGGEEGAMTYPAGSEHRKSYEAGVQAAREGIVGSSFEAVSTTSSTKEEPAYELSEKTSITPEQAERDRKAREQAERDRKAREAREQAERDRKAREAREQAERDRKAREAREQAERDRKAREAREQAERDRKAREAREQAERDRKAREAREQAERDRKAREAREQAERDRKAREAREQAERDRKAREAREQAERDRKAREAREQAEREEGTGKRENKLRGTGKRGNKLRGKGRRGKRRKKRRMKTARLIVRLRGTGKRGNKLRGTGKRGNKLRGTGRRGNKLREKGRRGKRRKKRRMKTARLIVRLRKREKRGNKLRGTGKRGNKLRGTGRRGKRRKKRRMKTARLIVRLRKTGKRGNKRGKRGNKLRGTGKRGNKLRETGRRGKRRKKRRMKTARLIVRLRKRGKRGNKLRGTGKRGNKLRGTGRRGKRRKKRRMKTARLIVRLRKRGKRGNKLRGTGKRGNKLRGTGKRGNKLRGTGRRGKRRKKRRMKTARLIVRLRKTEKRGNKLRGTGKRGNKLRGTGRRGKRRKKRRMKTARLIVRLRKE